MADPPQITVATVSAGSLNHAIAGGINRRARRAGGEIEPFVRPRIAEHKGLDIKPQRLIGDTAYATAEFLNWMINERAIEPHVPLWEKGERGDGTFSRSDFVNEKNPISVGAQSSNRKKDSKIAPLNAELVTETGQ